MRSPNIKHLSLLFAIPLLLCFKQTEAPCNPEPLGKTEWKTLFKCYEWVLKSNKYQPDTITLSQIKLNKNQKWIVFAGTWCSDTKTLLPHFVQIAKQKEQTDSLWKNWENKFDLYLLDMDKSGEDATKYKVEFVPTFILLDNEIEIGRITETVEESLEKSMLELFEKD